MINALNSALSGLNVSGKRLTVSAHNTANVSTTAFVPNRLEQAEMAAGGAQVIGISPTTNGGVRFTGRSLDLAIEGGGFFAFNDGQQGQVYSRAGNLRVNAEGGLTDAMGRTLSPPVTLPAQTGQIDISPEGLVTALDAQGNVLNQQQIQTASFANAGGLQAVGDNNYIASQASGPAFFNGNQGRIVSGALQTSGTSIAHEMTEQIVSQRSFEANLKTMQTADEMLGYMLDIKA